VKVAMPHLRGR